MLRALAAQGGVSYLPTFDVSRVDATARRGCRQTTVRALGLVPFEIDEARAARQVICTAPVPRAALRALAKLTGWTAEPYLVDDEVWDAGAATPTARRRRRAAAGDSAR